MEQVVQYNKIGEMVYGLYIHFPFCNSKCPYCAFFSSISEKNLIERYSAAAVTEYEKKRGLFRGFPLTVYFGGGTPSIVPEEHLVTVIENIPLENAVEFTVEANPESVSKTWMKELLSKGVNRISIGIQSFDDRLLAGLGRVHDAEIALKSFKMAENAGFTNISIDLMFGIPGQTIKNWMDTIEMLLRLAPKHISCYGLTIEEDTDFMDLARKKELLIPDNEETADMYLYMSEKLEGEGYSRYEISNFALEGYECVHNKLYWDHTPYLGIGASAHSFTGERRIWNISDIRKYIENNENGEDITGGFEIIDGKKKILESIMLKIRTSAGLDVNETGKLISQTPELYSKGQIDTLRTRCGLFAENGFIHESSEDVFTLTPAGAMISDEITYELATIFD